MRAEVEGFVKRAGQYPAKEGKPARFFVQLGGMEDFLLLMPYPVEGVAEGDYVVCQLSGHVAYITGTRAVCIEVSAAKFAKKGG